MARKGNKPQPASAPAEDVEHEIAAIAAMDVYHLRELWREQEQSEPPAGLTKDLLARVLTYRLQERAFGGVSASTSRLLRSFDKQDTERLRHIKIGSVLIREHEGERHEVIAVPGGFLWQGRTYESLSSDRQQDHGDALERPTLLRVARQTADRTAARRPLVV